jgi:hypothetical protein
MSDTIQEMYFETANNMTLASNWLDGNLVSSDYTIRESGVYPGQSYYYLNVWFADLSIACAFYDANSALIMSL